MRFITAHIILIRGMREKHFIIKKVNSDKGLSEQLSKNAKKMIATNYNEQRSTEQFIALCKELV